MAAFALVALAVAPVAGQSDVRGLSRIGRGDSAQEYWDIVASKYDFGGDWSREVAPGMYRVLVEYVDTMPPQLRQIGPFEVADDDHVKHDV